MALDGVWRGVERRGRIPREEDEKNGKKYERRCGDGREREKEREQAISFWRQYPLHCIVAECVCLFSLSIQCRHNVLGLNGEHAAASLFASVLWSPLPSRSSDTVSILRKEGNFFSGKKSIATASSTTFPAIISSSSPSPSSSSSLLCISNIYSPAFSLYYMSA